MCKKQNNNAALGTSSLPFIIIYLFIYLFIFYYYIINYKTSQLDIIYEHQKFINNIFSTSSGDNNADGALNWWAPLDQVI